MSQAHTELKPLRHVVALAKTLNYTRAAQTLNLSQSALTRSIQATEQRTQLRIFDRDRGGVHLTPAGKTFVERASSLIREADEFDRQVQRLAGGTEYDIAFGMAPLPAKALLPELATEAFEDLTDFRWQVEINSAPDLLRMLLDEKIEFFLSAEEQLSDNAPVKALALGSFPLTFVVSAGHPLLIAPDCQQIFPVVSVAAIQNYQSFPDALKPRLNYPPKLIINDYALLATITSQTNAVWPTSSFAVFDELQNGNLEQLKVTEGDHASQLDIVMYSLQKRSLSPAAFQLQRRFQSKIQQLKKFI